MQKQRILELVLESLERERARIDSEITDIKAQFGKKKPAPNPPKKRKRKPQSAEHKAAVDDKTKEVTFPAAQSARLKKIWAEKKAEKKG